MSEVSMPRLSDTMQEGTITRWLKQPGDEVKKGDIIAEVETDKANMEVESFDAGILEQILVKEGETAPIGQTIAVVGSGQNVQKAAPATSVATNQQSASVATMSNGTTNGQSPANAPLTTGSRTQENSNSNNIVQAGTNMNSLAVKASPLARRMAEEHGIDLQQLKGTGPYGRIVRDDIEDFLEQQRMQSAQPVQSAPVQTQPVAQQAQPVGSALALQEGDEVKNLSSMQKTVARRLAEAKLTVPHFYVSNEVDVTDALALRKQLNATADENGIKISVNDLVIKACALALEKFPDVNSSFGEGQFVHHQHINIGMAVDIPNGLVVPVIRDANIKGVRSIARESKALVEKARTGKLAPADFTGGTFSISNLGMMDVTNFVPIINPPEAAILAVSSARKVFVPINDQPVIRDIMPLTISADHRIIYGAAVARFLQEVKRLLQNPYDLLG
jgi:pyruvate dehydrogenase E2 component (dihydrolipoamide acetyltransferase)